MLILYTISYAKLYIWRFPEIGVPPNHPFIDGFPIINHPFGDTPMTMETNTYMNHIYRNHHIYVTLLAIFQYIAMHFDTTPISQCAAREFLESRPDKFLVTPTTGRPWAMG